MANIGRPGPVEKSSSSPDRGCFSCVCVGFGVRSYLELVLAALSLRGRVEEIDSENLVGRHVSNHLKI
jgi:hypothetical protein